MYWHLVVDELRSRGAQAIPVDLPAADDSAGLAEYTDIVVDAIGDRTGIILVAQSMAGLTAPLVCERVPVELLVLVNAMVPLPGEAPGDWWGNTGFEQARVEQAARDGRTLGGPQDLLDSFFHDVPPDITAQAMAHGELVQSDTPFAKPWPLAAWPEVPTRFLQGRDDRFFPVEFQRRVARERLGITPDEMPGGHLLALAQPMELANRLEAYRAELHNLS